MIDYYLLSHAKTFAFSAENPSGTKSGGSKGGLYEVKSEYWNTAR